jgi:hypothetical protein
MMSANAADGLTPDSRSSAEPDVEVGTWLGVIAMNRPSIDSGNGSCTGS